LYVSLTVIRESEIDGACSTHGKDVNCIKILVGKPEEKRPRRRYLYRWEDNIRMDLKEILWVSVGLNARGSG
jgi:hypothetical protein